MYQWEEVEELHFPKPEIVRLHVEENGVVWLGSGKQLFRYDTGASTVASSIDTTFQALVREVAAVEGEQVLYGGAPRSASAGPLTIPYQQNDLQIQVAAPRYSTSGDQDYQFRLDGHEGSWSEWTETPQVTYTNLWEGTYTFQVRARTETGVVSAPAQLTMRIQPPWYRTGGAYAVYVGLLAVIGLVGRRYYRLRRASQRAQKRAEELRQERVVNERLTEANEQLREANRLKEEFLANISHELRTPLTNILGFADVLRENASEEQRTRLGVVEENSRRLLDTLEALLDLATLRSGEAEPDVAPVEVRRQVQTVVQEIRSQAEEKGLEVRTDVPSKPLYAQIDERYFRQVLRNLLENAVKFTPEGHIAVTAEREEGHVAVTVTDTGIGIDEAFRPNVFEDFKQESGGMARTYEGSGLGLAISQRLVQIMDGNIDVESTKGEGSAFTVRVPQASGTPDLQGEEMEEVAPSNT
jgi:signal transduction histidine kinase